MPPVAHAVGLPVKHRGGSWKVAYADFVTAMMALFIVLWMMNASHQVQRSVAAYFRNPKGHAKIWGDSEGGPGGKGPGSVSITKENVLQLKEKLEQAIQSLPEFQKLKRQVQISVTPEGLRVELLETEKGFFFESGRPEPSSSGVQVLAVLARELARLKNDVVLEGHTDARPYRFADLNGYTNWELSVDRANSARRCMMESGLSLEQVVQIRGFADKRPLNAADPYDSRNRRVSVVVQYGSGPPATEKGKTRRATNGHE
jgi:chemotaxis protein MotB